MLDVAGAEIITACGSIIATSATLTGMFYKRIQSSENKFHKAFDEMNKKLNRIDINLAVNTAFIDQLLKQKER
jgi:hypothetical protein